MALLTQDAVIPALAYPCQAGRHRLPGEALPRGHKSQGQCELRPQVSRVPCIVPQPSVTKHKSKVRIVRSQSIKPRLRGPPSAGLYSCSAGTPRKAAWVGQRVLFLRWETLGEA